MWGRFLGRSLLYVLLDPVHDLGPLGLSCRIPGAHLANLAMLASAGASSRPASAYFLNWQDICPSVTELLSSCLWNREETDYQEAFPRLPYVSHLPKQHLR